MIFLCKNVLSKAEQSLPSLQMHPPYSKLLYKKVVPGWLGAGIIIIGNLLRKIVRDFKRYKDSYNLLIFDG